MSALVFSPLGPYERLPLHYHTETLLHWTAASERNTVADVRAKSETFVIRTQTYHLNFCGTAGLEH